MSDKISFSCSVEPLNPSKPVGFELWFDGKCVTDITSLTETTDLKFEFEEADCEHCVEFVLKNKTAEHTTVDAQGNIVNDSTIKLKNICLDELDITNIVQNVVKYHHDFNGTADPIIDEFYREMGCNGRAVLKFSDPVYLWLLENL